MITIRETERFKIMKPVKTTVWDPADYLETEEQITAYLEDIFKSGDSDIIVAAIGDVARARGMSKIADDTGRGRESLYKSLSQGSNPSFETVLKVLISLGFGLSPRRRE
ncbi:MAG: putative addiction module antidote protein [Spirochaetaceae bacterium]|jgi:probable addiction module antidote protein|nr:putative addiction module antidote protein [Spirochaetaceae bacterium]